VASLFTHWAAEGRAILTPSMEPADSGRGVVFIYIRSMVVFMKSNLNHLKVLLSCIFKVFKGLLSFIGEKIQIYQNSIGKMLSLRFGPDRRLQRNSEIRLLGRL